MTTVNMLQEFLPALHPPESGLTELRALPRKAQDFFTATDADAIRVFLDTHASENIYFGMATRMRCGDGSAANCGELHALFVDIDFQNDAHPQGVPESEARATLERFPLTPSIIVASGGGLYPIWLLREPLNLQVDAVRAKSLLRRLALALRGDLSAAEVARILRLPGTLNHKYTPPQRVTIERFDSEQRYNPCDFDDFLPEEPHTTGNSRPERFEMPPTIHNGQRNQSLYRLARSLKARGLSHDAILAALRVENAAKCDPPLEDSEIEKLARNAYEQPDRPEFTANGQRANEQHADTQNGASITEFRLSDVGNAARFAAMHGHDLRFVAAWGRWLCWDGVRWQQDETGEVMRRAREVAMRVYREAAAEPDEMRRKVLSQHAVRLDSDAKLRAMLHLAESEPAMAVRGDVFDRDPWLLNCANGTINLKTGELQPHRREDLITKTTGVMFDPAAPCPQWEAFLDRVMDGKQSLIDYLQRHSGYCLTGVVSEHGFDLPHGGGANGKSTYLNTLLAMLGDYAKTAAPGLLLRKHSDSHPTELADLLGARLVTSVEFEEGARLNEALVKQLSGGDHVKGRYMRADFFEFNPTWKLIVGTNHRPVIRGTDFAIWRRVRLIPFTVTIPPDEQDRELPDKLKAELPGILAWAVRGCLEWQERGLNPPHEVQAATDDYRRDMDLLADFLDACCILAPTSQVTAKALYGCYAEWCKDTGEYAVSQKRLGAALGERGFERKRTGQGYCWLGLELSGDMK